MYDILTERIISNSGYKIQVRHNGVHLTFAQLFRLWYESDLFCLQFTEALTRVPYSAFFWELPSLTHQKIHSAFECVVINSPILANRRSNNSPFRTQLQQKTDIVTFPNLGGDATLLVPTLQGEIEAYCHLAIFLRQAPKGQVRCLWKEIGKEVSQRISYNPLWVSTSGLGVSWLHVRLDKQPKYYVFQPYRQE